jgi:hypothetical protein
VNAVAIDTERRRIVATAQYLTLAGSVITVTGHLDPNTPDRNAYHLVCEGCGLDVTYNAAAYMRDLVRPEICDQAARIDAKNHGVTHVETCAARPGTRIAPAPVTVPLDVRAAATLLFASEVAVEALNGADLRDVLAAEFTRRGCDLSGAVAEVAYEYGEHPETAAAHMQTCVIVASRLAGVTV